MDKFGDKLRNINSSQEYFFPIENSAWDKGEYRNIEKGRETIGLISGLRLQAYDRNGKYLSLEKETQYDLKRLIESIIELRKYEGCQDIIVSKRFISIRQTGRHKGKRVKVGLLKKNKYQNEQLAALTAYKNIRSIINRNFFRIENEREFDDSKGFLGLIEWLDTIRLAPILNWRYLFLGLLLLPLLNFCSAPEIKIGYMSVKTDNVILIVDVSGSMSKVEEFVRNDVLDRLESLLDSQGLITQYSINVIRTNQNLVDPVFDTLVDLNEESLKKVRQEMLLDVDGESGSLIKSIDLAIAQANKEDEEVTILLFSDGEDSPLYYFTGEISPGEIYQDSDVVLHAMSPRTLALDKLNAEPEGDGEIALKTLATFYHGNFGKSK